MQAILGRNAVALGNQSREKAQTLLNSVLNTASIKAEKSCIINHTVWQY